MKKQRILILTLFIIVILSGMAMAQAQTISKNLSLADMIRYEELYQFQAVDTTNNITLTDIASWKDSRDGKEYALIGLLTTGTGSGLAMVDVTDPGSAVHVKTIRISNEDHENKVQDVKVLNNIAYVGQDNNQFIPAYWVNLEMAADESSSLAGTDSTGFGFLTSIEARIHNVHVNPDHELLYLSDFRNNESIQVFDISDVPNSPPQLVGQIPQIFIDARSHDLFAIATSATVGRVYDASIVAVTMSDYTWNKGTNNFQVGTQIAHEFNPLRGQHPGDFSNPVPSRGIHSTWIGHNPDYLFTTVEGIRGDHSVSTWVPVSESFYQRSNYLSVWDISDPYAPDNNGYRYDIKQVYEVRENTVTGDGLFEAAYFPELTGGEKANSIHNIHTRGNSVADTAYISYYTRGIRILDVTDPTNMSEMAFYDIDGLEEYIGPVYNGAFGVDPYLPGGTILGSSSDGLYVFRRLGHFGGSVRVPTRWTIDITVVDNLSVDSLITVQGEVTVSYKADMILSNDIAMTEGSLLTLASADGITTISSADGVKTIGIAGTGGSAKIVGGSGANETIRPDTEVVESRAGRFHLSQNFPNPFNPQTMIRYEVAEDSEVLLEVYDILGRRVAVLVSEMKQAGVHQASWDAKSMATGMYILRIRAGNYIQSRQMILVK